MRLWFFFSVLGERDVFYSVNYDIFFNVNSLFTFSPFVHFLSIWLSVCLCIYLSVYLSIDVSIHLFFFVIQLRPPTVIGQFHTLFFGSVRMFFLGVLGFAVYGNEALHFSCDPDSRELNLFCYNQFRPITPQVKEIHLHLLLLLCVKFVFSWNKNK